jgi:hypothetical protein
MVESHLQTIFGCVRVSIYRQASDQIGHSEAEAVNAQGCT